MKYSFSTIKKAAQIAAERTGYLEHRDIFESLRRLGGEVEYVSVRDLVEKGHIKIQKDKFTVFVPQCTGPIRDKTTIAAGIGLYLMKLEDWNDEIRSMAFCFATSFLIPENEWKLMKDNENCDLHFGVNKVTIVLRKKYDAF